MALTKKRVIIVMILLFGGLLFSPNSVTRDALALNDFIDPNADGSVGNWSSTGANYFSEVDEAIRQPNTPTLADNVTAAANNGGSIYLNMDSIVGVTTVTQIEVWMYHNDGSNGEILVQLYDDNEATTRSGQTALTQSTTNAWHSVTFSGLSLSQAELDTLSVQLTANKNGGGGPATITVYALYADVTYSNVTPSFEQSGFRFFNSVNSTDVGTPLAAQDSPAVLNAGGDEFRIRMLVHVNDANLALNGQDFKLQFAGKGTGTCASPTGGTPATYTDVTAATAIAYNNLTGGVADGDALTLNANDPTHSGDSVIAQTVEEANNFTNTQGLIAVGSDGLWDFALIDDAAPAATTYCFRIVEADGTVLSSYSQYPQVTTGNGVLAVDIVDAVGASVAAPTFAMSPTGYLFICATTSTTLGTSSQIIEVSNFTATPSWTVSIAATAGNTSTWSDGGTNSYDYNDGAGVPAGCADGADADSVAGQLTLDPSVATSTPSSGCNNTGISLGSTAGYQEATTDSITLINASGSAQVGCAWGVTGVDAQQYIPQDQADGNYSINFTITATAI